MNRNHILYFFAVVFLISCKPKQEADYRQIYVGNYNLYFNSEIIIPVTPAVYHTFDTNYVGSISMSETNSLKVEWFDGTTRDFHVSQNGILSDCPDVTAGSISSSGIDINYKQSDCPNTPNTIVTLKLSGSKQ